MAIKACEASWPFIGATDMNGIHGGTHDIILKIGKKKRNFTCSPSVPRPMEKISKMFPEDL